MLKSRLAIIFLFIFSVTLTVPIQSTYSQQQSDMKVHFINVGQGDSILIQTPSDKNILIDGGPPSAGKKVVAYLKKQQVKKLDLMVATHPDIDHIGGLTNVMKSLDVKRVLDSGKVHPTKTYMGYMYQVLKQKIPIQVAREGDRVKLDPEVDIHILNAYSGMKSNNESSIVLKISFGEVDFLLMGDVKSKQEKKLLDKHDLQSEIVKVAHHGSKTSTSLAFLKEVSPEIALISYSKKNDYGHPVNRVVENLHKVNADIYSTAVYGDVIIQTNGENYFVFPEKSPAGGLVESAS